MAVLLDEGLGQLFDESGSVLLLDEDGPPVPGAVSGSPRLVFAVGPGMGIAPVQEVTAFSSFTIKRSLASGPELSFTMPARSPAALLTDGLVTDVWVYKKGALFMRCRAMPVDQTWGESGEDDASVTAVGYKRVVEARNIVTGPPTFVNVDQGTILWNLIQHTQAQTNGNLGIGLGPTFATGVLRVRQDYAIGDNLGKIMADLGDVINGVWWDVDEQKLMVARLPSAFPVRTDPIVHGANARSLTRQRGRSFANASGAVGSKTLTVWSWVEDVGLPLDPRGRWETTDTSHGDVILQSTVLEYAQGNLADRLHPPSIWTISLDPFWYFDGGSDYREGEFVNIVVPATAVDEIGPPPVDVMAQITEVSITLDDSGAIAVTLAAVEVSG